MTEAMIPRTPAPADNLPDTLSNFTPVPRKRIQHNGWMPERQRAFIQALAETGSATRAARMVNMTVVSAYQLRRSPGAEGFRKAWSAALDCGIERIRDIAFERAVEGEIIPVFHKGDLIGYRRKFNNQLLMFILRHYGRDGEGRRVTVNYFKSSAGAAAEGGSGTAQARSEATTMVVRSSGPSRGRATDCVAIPDDAGLIVDGFEGETLDPATMDMLQKRLIKESDFRNEVRHTRDDPVAPYMRHDPKTVPLFGELVDPEGDTIEPYNHQEPDWESLSWFKKLAEGDGGVGGDDSNSSPLILRRD